MQPTEGGNSAPTLEAPPRPPEARSSAGFAGLLNQGATCYLNSVIQSLFVALPFRNEILSLSRDELRWDDEPSFIPEVVRSEEEDFRAALLAVEDNQVQQDVMDLFASNDQEQQEIRGLSDDDVESAYVAPARTSEPAPPAKKKGIRR